MGTKKKSSKPKVCKFCRRKRSEHGNKDQCPLVLTDGVRIGFSGLYKYAEKG